MKKLFLFLFLTMLGLAYFQLSPGQGISYTEGVDTDMPEVQGSWRGLFLAPESAAMRDEWLKNLRSWKEKIRKDAEIDHENFLDDFEWIGKNFVFTQMMAHDRYFYDPDRKKYTVNRYLDDLEERYGGINGVLVWPTYPNMGVDNRNQFDYFHGMPGGIEALKEMVKDFHNRGVKVFLPIMIWDNGRRMNNSMAEEFARFAKEIGIDGLNGDTMYGIPEEFFEAFKKHGYMVAFQPQMAVKAPKMLRWNKMGWGEFWQYNYKPGVSISKWIEPKVQIAVLNRWQSDRTNELQYAFFNGIGFNTWENLWGIWNQISERDGLLIKKIASIYEAFWTFFSSDDWEPFVKTYRSGVFASGFPVGDEAVFTLINRDSEDKKGPILVLPYESGGLYYNLWTGREIKPEKKGDSIWLDFEIAGNGFGAIFRTKRKDMDIPYGTFFKKMRELSQVNVSQLSGSWHPLKQRIVPIPTNTVQGTVKDDMILITGVQDFQFISEGTMIEGDPLPDAVGVQYPWAQHPVRKTTHEIEIQDFYIDKYPVTNREFKRFLDETNYHPEDDYNFLKDWVEGMYPEGWGNKPVTWISIEDARAYATWAGKRLPHEWEWQYAAQGPDLNLYPWGNVMDSTRIPRLDTGPDMRPPTDVDEFPEGRSFFGVVDMVGNVWQWTDEYEDEHTRAAVLKGGGYYRTSGSDWYFPRPLELNKYNKYLLMAPSLDRSGAIGFRCVRDK